MSGREEFDWSRMRREEDDYFATKQNLPSLAKTLLDLMLRKIAGGQHRSQEEAEKISALRNLSYKQYLLTSHWKTTRRLAIERDGHACRQCATRKNLDVHHVSYERLGEERASDLITLCRRCHELKHAK